MKWNELIDIMWEAHNDITHAAELGPSDKYGEEKARETKLDQETIDMMYNLLNTGIANVQAAMDKLRPHTTDHQEKSIKRDDAFALLMNYKEMTINLGKTNEDLHNIKIGMINFLFSQSDLRELLTRWRAIQPPLQKG